MSAHSRKIFVNLAVRDLKKSMAFYAALGFTNNPQFTNDKGACMIVSDEAFLMLLTHEFFSTFTSRQICDTSTHVEGLFAISCASRAEVDELVNAALASGGSRAMDAQDLGFMYSWSFIDPDGHQWEPVWMDPAAFQAMPQQGGER
jgi:hypothetical protein